MQRGFQPFGLAIGVFILFFLAGANSGHATARQQSLNEWRSLTASNAPPPRVVVKGDQVKFYFPAPAGFEVFKARWGRLRIPTRGFKVHSALLRWDQKINVPPPEHGWREATVIAGAEWRRLATNLLAELTPRAPGHGAYYQAFLSDRLLYRDSDSTARSRPVADEPADLVVEKRFSLEETLEMIARSVEGHLARTHPGDTLFLLMAPDGKRFTQPLLLDRRQHRCVFLAPAALYDPTEQASAPVVTAQGLSALIPESHGLALIKNPVSSAARLADLGVVSLIRFIRLPLPSPRRDPPPCSTSEGMDLRGWESWLDRYTGTRRELGSIRLLLDGDGFFPSLYEGMASATNRIYFNVYIFDRDDVAVKVADVLKARSREVDVRVILDRMGSIAAGMSPPATPLPEDFSGPSSILSYLGVDSKVKVRPFLNPWLSADHSKVLLVDGQRAWLGGMNLGREYRYEWHDLMVEVQGPVVTSLETEFLRQWAHAGPFGDAAYLVALLKGGRPGAPVLHPDRLVDLRLLPTKTAWKPFGTAVLGSLRRARNHIFLENPYLFDKRTILELVRARNRGVDVRVILPSMNDLKVGGRGNLVIANYLLEHGVRVYFYPGMTHVKALLVDGWACVGSGNLNHLSLRVNQEQNLATSDPTFAATLRQTLFEADFERSYELDEPVSVEWLDFMADILLEGF